MTAKTNLRTLLYMTTALCALSGCFGGTSTKVSEQQRRINDLNDRALTSSDKGYDDESERLLQEALQLASSHDDTDGQIITLLNQARLARKQSNLRRAGTILEQALARTGGSVLYADVAHEKALQELAAKRLDEAEKWAGIALQAERGDMRGRRLNLQARVALLQGKQDQALRTAEQALSANRSESLAEERANSLRMIGQIKAQQKLFADAEELLQQALALDKHVGLPAKIAADLEALAEVAGLRGNSVGQADLVRRATNVKENMEPRRKKTNPASAGQPATTSPSSKP